MDTGPDTSTWPDLYPATEPRIDPSHYGNSTLTAADKKRLGITTNDTIWALPKPAGPQFNSSTSIQNHLRKTNAAFMSLPYSSLAQEEELPKDTWASLRNR